MSFAQRPSPSVRGGIAVALIALAVSAVAQTAANGAAKVQPRLAKIRETGVVTIANRPDAFPVAYLDANKQPVGYGIDVCREIVRLLERDLKKSLRLAWVEVNARTRFDVIASGKADIECGNTINDPLRRSKGAGYSMPYLFTGPRFLVRADSKIRGIHDLPGKRICVVPGTNSVPLLDARIKAGILRGTQLVEYKSYDDCTRALERGDVDAFATIDLLLAGQRAKSKNPDALQIVGTFLVLEPAAILLRKEDVEFKRTIDRHLAALMLDGTVERLYDKWFLQPIPPDNLKLELPMSAAMRDQLRWPTDRLGDELSR
ncbi:MAG: amino acid ABC transporter substrate-binding protein [Burkholderiaceae bacterium]